MSITTATSAAAMPSRVGWRKRGVVWIRRVALALLVTITALSGTGAIYQAIATTRDKAAYPAPGQLVDVGGYKLHINCVGQGSPTVILESAFPGTSADWAWVQPEVARTTRVCSYDRAGMGWSEPGSQPRDARQIAADLHTLLERSGVGGPYVLVGHSLGGLFVRAYAAEYPGQIAGMVLVDATHPDLWQRLPPELGLPPDWQIDLIPVFARLGIVRAGLLTPFPVDPALPEQQQAAIAALNNSTSAMTAIAGELRAIPATAAQVRAAGTLSDRPLLVLTAANTYPQLSGPRGEQANRVWKELQAELAALSSNSGHREIAGTTHESLVYKQQDAQATIDAIRDVVQAARTGEALKQ